MCYVTELASFVARNGSGFRVYGSGEISFRALLALNEAFHTFDSCMCLQAWFRVIAVLGMNKSIVSPNIEAIEDDPWCIYMLMACSAAMSQVEDECQE